MNRMSGMPPTPWKVGLSSPELFGDVTRRLLLGRELYELRARVVLARIEEDAAVRRVRLIVEPLREVEPPSDVELFLAHSLLRHHRRPPLRQGSRSRRIGTGTCPCLCCARIRYPHARTLLRP